MFPPHIRELTPSVGQSSSTPVPTWGLLGMMLSEERVALLKGKLKCYICPLPRATDPVASGGRNDLI